jgi:hypothetical protein
MRTQKPRNFERIENCDAAIEFTDNLIINSSKWTKIWKENSSRKRKITRNSTVTGIPDQIRTGIAENRFDYMTLPYYRYPATRVAQLVLTRSRSKHICSVIN